MNWQPIDTAPENEQVIVLDDWGIPTLATLVNKKWYNDDFRYFVELRQFDFPDVFLSKEEQEQLSLLESDPVYWAPIPIPPETKE